jgi:hypothetical protein
VRTRAYDRRVDHVDKRDGFLFASLGLVAALARFDALLDRYAPAKSMQPPRTRTATPARDDATDDDSRDDVLMVLLGLVALRGHCGVHLSRMACTTSGNAPAGAPPAAVPRPSRLQGILR